MCIFAPRFVNNWVEMHCRTDTSQISEQGVESTKFNTLFVYFEILQLPEKN